MTTKPELRVHEMLAATGGVNTKYEYPSSRPASVADLVAALIAEGGEIQTPMWDEFSQVSLPFSGSVIGRYLVFPIPVDEDA